MVQLRNQGIVLGEDSEKMSKSRGNVVSPDDLVGRYGADTVRAYLMFFARWDMGAPWNSSGIEGHRGGYAASGLCLLNPCIRGMQILRFYAACAVSCTDLTPGYA